MKPSRYLATVVLTGLGVTATGHAEVGGGTLSDQSRYALYCMGCHGVNGEGLPPAIPNLRQSLPILTQTAAGRDYMLRVPGVSRAGLPPAELAAVLNWIERDMLAISSPHTFTATEILAGRAAPLSNPMPVRQQLIPDEQY